MTSLPLLYELWHFILTVILYITIAVTFGVTVYPINVFFSLYVILECRKMMILFTTTQKI